MLAGQAAAVAPPPIEEAKKAEELEAIELERELGATTALQPAPSKSVWAGLIPQMSFILDVAGAYYTSEPHDGGGHDPSGTGFTFQQLELHARSNVDHVFSLDINMVFSPFGVEVEEAVASTLGLPGGLQFRLGQFLTRFGRMNPTHPHAWAFVDQSLLRTTFFGSEGSRGLGGEASWLTGLPWYVELSAAMTEAGGECCARSFYGGADVEIDGVEDFLYTLALKQFFDLNDDWSLSFGLSAQFGPNASGRDSRTEIYGADLYLRFRPVASTARRAVSLAVESMFRTQQVPNDVRQDIGVHAELVADLTQQWQIGGRYEYLSGILDAPSTSVDDSERHRGSLQVTYFPSHFSRLRLQGNHDRSAAPGVDAIWAGILSVEFTIGAHGGHAF